MFDDVIPRLKRRGDVFLAVVGLRDPDGYLSDEVGEMITHELLHAQYFVDLRYRATVNSYWQARVPPEEQKAITTQLGYLPSIIVDEFQAFALAPTWLPESIEALIDPHREPLRDALIAAGTSPIKAW